MNIQQIGAFEAKTRFSRIIEEVERGADFVITRRGKPVAKIVPFTQEKEMTRKEALAKIIEMRKLHCGKPGYFSVREAVEEGRK
ncbi:MAG: type II toxin-antitoxin system prevent-host-death family antitoxin [Treponema sp.]|nr:type II toxin-antitoxin system prevent-host-death family antitoxin [Treponema sp.]